MKACLNRYGVEMMQLCYQLLRRNGETKDVPVFHPVRAPTLEQLPTLLNQIIKRIMKLLKRKGYDRFKDKDGTVDKNAQLGFLKSTERTAVKP